MSIGIDQSLHAEIRDGVRAVCNEFDSAYWQQVDDVRGYPDAFVKALTDAGWLSALIPEEYGGSGLSLTEASIIMEEINRSGGNSGACHGQMYNMGTLLRHGSAEQKTKYLPKIATGELRLQSMGVTEPTAGTDTTSITTMALSSMTPRSRGVSRRATASLARRPRPGMAKTLSVTTEKAMVLPSSSPTTVTTGIRIFLNTCTKVTRAGESPLARAVRM